MPTDPLFIDANDSKLKNKLDGLKKTPGYCIFIDIVGSTAMKQDGMSEWVALIHNCFADAATIFKPLKSIGDELMFYIEGVDLESSGNTVLTIFDQLIQIATNSNSAYPPSKIVAAYCTSVYPMTFLRNTRDYYGIDIDRTARIRSTPMVRELVIDSNMYDKIKVEYDRTANKQQFPLFPLLKGPLTIPHEDSKGIPLPIQVYRTGSLDVENP